MDLRKIKKLIELLEESALIEMEITEGDNTIRLSRAGRPAPATIPHEHAVTVG
ncbi:MAG: acetyl-CoA carboxylase biotin carboxyl carrier protein, partial [Gammaproteobacteria bacterium]|nr:acetyl-CoA carboxylase biotin carboxyl carrier protein [Gammaproteobacteria bacterium]